MFSENAPRPSPLERAHNDQGGSCDDRAHGRNAGGVAEPPGALLEREKELTRLSDELVQERRELPWVRVDKDYRFETEDGTRTLVELFDGRSAARAHTKGRR